MSLLLRTARVAAVAVEVVVGSAAVALQPDLRRQGQQEQEQPHYFETLAKSTEFGVIFGLDLILGLKRDS